MAEKQKKSIFSNYTINAIFIILIGVLMIALSFGIGGEGIVDVLKMIDIMDIILVIFIVLLWQFVIGLILVVLTRISHPKYKVIDGYINVLVAALFHGITPSASGGQIAQFYVFKKQKVDTGDAGSILWIEFIIYQITLTFISAFFIIIRFNDFYSNYSSLFLFVILGFIINGSVIAFLIALAKFKKLHDWIKNKGVYIGVKLHVVKDPEKAIQNIEVQLERFRNEVGNFKDHKGKIVLAFFMNILRLLIYYSVPFFVFVAMGQDVDLGILIDCIAMGSFVAITSSMIPIPGASGGTEMIFVLMFGNLFGQTVASAGMLLWRFVTYYLVMAIGAVLFLYIKLKKVKE